MESKRWTNPGTSNGGGKIEIVHSRSRERRSRRAPRLRKSRGRKELTVSQQAIDMTMVFVRNVIGVDNLDTL